VKKRSESKEESLILATVFHLFYETNITKHRSRESTPSAKAYWKEEKGSRFARKVGYRSAEVATALTPNK
jgi:hypothetical protein